MSSTILKHLAVSVGALTFAALATCSASAQMFGGGPCGVAIKTPYSGGGVSYRDSVTGAATLPGDAHLWVFTHRKGLPKWWAQGGGEVRATLFGWQTNVNYGVENRNEVDFELAAVPVDARANELLLQWIRHGESTGEFNGMSLPPAFPGCRAAIVAIRRVR